MDLKEVSTIVASEENREKLNRDKIDKIKKDYERFYNYYTSLYEEKVLSKVDNNLLKKFKSTSSITFPTNSKFTNHTKADVWIASNCSLYTNAIKTSYTYYTDCSKKEYEFSYIVHHADTAPDKSQKLIFPKEFNKAPKTIEEISKNTTILLYLKEICDHFDELTDTWYTSNLSAIKTQNKKLENTIESCKVTLPWEEVNLHGEK